MELVTLDRETRFAFVDNPPRRRERAGDLFMINARLRDSSNRPTGRLDASFAETPPPPRVVAQGSATFILGNGQIMVSGPIVDRGRTDRTDTFAVIGGSGAYTAARRLTGLRPCARAEIGGHRPPRCRGGRNASTPSSHNTSTTA